MKFDDSDEDYFLHDFSKQPEAKENEPSQPTQALREEQRDATPTFDFSDESRENSGWVEPKPKRHRFMTWFFVILALVLFTTVYIRYFVPYVTESRTTGYVTLVEKRGILFRTFEGEMVSESLLNDTSRIYSRDLYFSIPDDSLALSLQKYQGTGRPVTVTCKRYYGTLPWRGASNVVLTSFTPATKLP